MNAFIYQMAATFTYNGPKALTDGEGNLDTSAILTLVFGTLGAVAVIVLILAGLRMILSGGANPQEVAKTKNTVIYAAIGLILALSALAVVQLVTEVVGW